MKNIEAVRAAIGEAERSANRPPGAVRLLAVSKTRTADEVRAAHAEGLTEFGENYVQEAVAKIEALADLDIVWHFVGAIQSNKTRDLARHFHWIHTVDRPRIATRLNDAATRPLNVCVQVNVDAEPQKAGVAPADLPGLVDCVAAAPRLRLRGLMAIPAPGGTRAAFARTRQLFDAMAARAGESWDTLSMGMTDDFGEAIGEGSTLCAARHGDLRAARVAKIDHCVRRRPTSATAQRYALQAPLVLRRPAFLIHREHEK